MNSVLFGANDGPNGNELRITDGTDAGTLLVQDIRPGGPDSPPGYLTAFRPLPSLSISADLSGQLEGDAGVTDFTFTVTRTGDLSGSSVALWSVSGLGATPANAADFGGSLPFGTIAFQPGESTQTITVQVTGGTMVELDEWFAVTLVTPLGATLGVASAETLIRNDDVPDSGGKINGTVIGDAFSGGPAPTRCADSAATTRSRAWAGMTRSMAATAPTCCSAMPAATNCSATPATTRFSAAPASCRAT